MLKEGNPEIQTRKLAKSRMRKVYPAVMSCME